MKKAFFILLSVMLSVSVMAQQRIQLRSVDRAECVNSNMTSLRASFSFSSIDAQDYESERGTFSWLSLPNTVLGGNAGDPQIPVVNQLIAVPFGANPRIEITSYSTTDYRLADYNMHTLVPRQRPVHKSQNPDEVPFIMNEAAYQVRGLRSEPQATVSVEGTMRGIQVGTMTIEPVSYDPVNNTIRVFNDIEVSVYFDGADTQATEDMLLKTYSPAFDAVYAQLFNNRAITDVYTDHPDMYNTPVKMLVVCYSGFQGNDALNSWLQWKLQKGYYVDIFYTSETGTSASSIASFIKTKYNASVSAGNAYTYLIVIGDTGQVPYYMVKNIDSSIGNCASDLGYSSVNFSSSTSNYFPDMYYSRISVENTTHLTNYINKVLTYEKFEFADGGNYLNNVILVGGWDSNWTNRVAKPTINYATNNYFNSSNTTYGGFGNGTIHATISTSSTQGWSGTNHGCYNGLNDGVCFLNYTAHGDKQEWQGPQFTAKQVETVTNTGKYFFGVGNCCLTGNYNLNNANYSANYAPSSSIGATASFGETMIRVPNAGAIAYVGCSPYSYWYEDFYWAVGAHSYSAGNAPSVSGSSKGVYDVMFNDQYWNSASALLYLGNLAVQQAVSNDNTTSSITDGDCNNSAHYYFQFYHCFGDGSVMPYVTKPETNTVSHANTISIGATSFAVSAVAGSYVAITKDNEILGVAEVPSSGSVNVSISGLTSAGDVKIVVTRQQYQPYITTIQAVSTSGPCISLDSYTPNIALIGQVTDLSMTFKNVGTTATSGATTVTLSSSDSNVTIDTPTKTFSALAVNASTTVSGFKFHFNSSSTVGFNYTIHYTVTNGNNIWEGDITVTANQVYTVTVAPNNNNYGTVTGGGQYNYGASCTVTATSADGYMFTNWTQNGNVVSSNAEYTFTVSSNISLVANFEAGVMIGDGSSSSNEYLPTYNYYKYSLTEQIYTSAELGGAGTITSIAFYNEGAEKTRTLDFYLKATTKSSFSSKTDWITVSSSDKVFSGSVTMVANDWTTITFNNPFVYDGTSNLVLVADDNSGAYTNSPHMACRVFTANSQAIYIYSDNTNYSPSSPSSYNGTVLSVKNQIILTKEAQAAGPCEITVSANPANGGTVTGAGTYDSGTTATLTATANEGYTFTNWTRNGVVISTNATYSFTVSTAAEYVANFTLNSYTITATAVPAEFGAVTVAGSRGNREDLVYDFEDGTQGWTVLKGNTGNSPNNWMHNTSYPTSNNNFTTGYGHNSSDGFMLSESYISGSSSGSGTAVTPDNYLVSPQVRLGGSISFYAGGRNTDYCAEKFSVMVSTTGNTNTASFTTVETMILSLDNAGYTSSPYTVDLSAYSGMGYVAIRHWDCYDQWVLCIDDITIVEGEDDSTDSGNFNYGETCTVTATPDEGYHFVNWTENGTEVSSEASYSFTVTGDRDLVANFQEGVEVTQTSELAAGLNWWTANVGVTLAELEAALGTNGLMISDNAGNFVTYTQFGWGSNPNFTELVPGRMYKIKTGANCSIDLTGVAINPSEVMITLNRGTNWIGFMGSTPVSVTDAFSGLAATVGDRISNGDGQYAKYSAYGWGGTLGALVPGEGYIYESKASGSITFTYSVSKSFDGKEGRDDTYHWTQPTPSLYSHRNHVTYQVRIDGVLQASNDIEVAAFIDEEVRGTVRLIEPYPGPLPDEYYTYLTVFGNAEDVGKYFTFKVYDHATSMEYDMCELSLVFRGEEEYEYGGLEMGYYIDFVTVPTWTLPIEAHTPDGGWYLITTPLAENTDAELVDNMISNDFDLYRFNQAVDLEWENWKNEESDHYHFNLEPGRGYLYANSGSVELTFRGEMYDGDCNVTIHNVGSGWNLIGNPYTVGASIGRGFYIMNPEGRAEIIPSEEDEIAPLEGVFVYTEEEEETVTFLIGNAKTTNTRERIVLNLSNDKGSIIDRVMVRMGESNTLPKYMLDESHTHISISRNGNDYAVVNGKDEEMFPVNFKAERTGTYTLTANVHDINVAYLHLIDNLTGADIDLLQTSSYTFNANTSDYASRFKLVFATDNDTDDSFAFISNGNIIVNGEGTLQVIDVQGRILISRRNDTHSISTSEMASGVYMLRLTNGSEIKTQKLIIR
jgi:hypothetical protein